jgi:radical SAM protein with 4Fe4S-binding SPASM domain
LSADVTVAEPERLVPLVDRLWQLAIPHATFIASESCDPLWLVRAVERTEDLGMIAGVRIRATDLLRGTLLADLATAGVDHVDVLCLSHDPAVHEAMAGPGDHASVVRAMAKLRELEVCAVAEIALVGGNLASIGETIGWLVGRDVTNAAIFAIATPDNEKASGPVPAGALVTAAMLVEESAESCGLRLLWYPPVRFDPTVALAEQVRRGPRASGDTAIRVEPGGAVIPARGPRRTAGNLMIDAWETIRDHPVYSDYRRRIESDTHCDTCPGLAICAAACPRDPAGWADERKAAEAKS